MTTHSRAQPAALEATGFLPEPVPPANERVCGGICEVTLTLPSGENIRKWPLSKHFNLSHEKTQIPSSLDRRPTPAKLRRGLRDKPTQSTKMLTLPEKHALSPGALTSWIPTPNPPCRGLWTDHKPLALAPAASEGQTAFQTWPATTKPHRLGLCPRQDSRPQARARPAWLGFQDQLPAPPGRSPPLHLQASTLSHWVELGEASGPGRRAEDMPAGGVGGQGHQHQAQPRLLPGHTSPTALRPGLSSAAGGPSL